MAIYRLSVKPMSRKTGRSATAAAAYRAAERIHDLTTDQVFDYTRKRGVEHAEIVLPAECAKQDINWARDRQALWNAAEQAENRSNSRVAREYELALPHELSKAQRLELVREFAADIANRHGVAVDFAIHAPHRNGDDRNWHAHLMATTRTIEAKGLGAKAAMEWSDGNRRKAGLGKAKVELKEIRGLWEVRANEKLKDLGLEIRIDHRSLAAQGIDRTPTTHLGLAVTGMERRGIETEVGKRIGLEQASKQLRQAAELGRVERDLVLTKKQILDVSTDLAAALKEREHTRSLGAGLGSGLDLAQVKARGREASTQWREALHQRQTTEKQAALEQGLRERTLGQFQELALGRERERPGYRDRSEEWLVTPETLRKTIDRFNALAPAAKPLALERMAKNPVLVRELQQAMDQRRDQVRQLDRGLEL